MFTNRRTLVAGVLTLVICSAVNAAPLRRYKPVDICGTIVERSWVPAEFRRGRPGFSGSLGHDRTFPAHVRVVLENYTGIDAATAHRINRTLGFADATMPQPPGAPQRLLLLLPTDDRALLAGVNRLCVEGFGITGDEGGTWTHYQRIVALPTERRVP